MVLNGPSRGNSDTITNTRCRIVAFTNPTAASAFVTVATRAYFFRNFSPRCDADLFSTNQL